MNEFLNPWIIESNNAIVENYYGIKIRIINNNTGEIKQLELTIDQINDLIDKEK